MNIKSDTYGIGPAIVAADAFFLSDMDSLSTLKEAIGHAGLCASTREFCTLVLDRMGARDNSSGLAYILGAGIQQIRRKLAHESLSGNFDFETACEYGVAFFKDAVVKPLRSEVSTKSDSDFLEDRDEELELIAALAAVSQFVVLFEVHVAYRSGNNNVSLEYLLNHYRGVALQNQVSIT